jgi:hypothetical protein
MRKNVKVTNYILERRWYIKAYISLFLFYYDNGTKFPPLLAMINLRHEICGVNKVSYPFPTEYSPYV